MTVQKTSVDSTKYYDVFSSNPQLGKLSQAQIRKLIDRCEILSLPAQTPIFHQGDTAEYGYFLISGQVSLSHTPDAPHETLSITAGNLFGLAPTLLGEYLPRDSSAWAEDDICVARFQLSQLSAPAKNNDAHQLSAFFPTDQLVTLSQTQKEFKAGDVIIEEGKPADDVYILSAGSVEVVKKQGDSLTIIGQIHEGGFFGERGILRGEPRAASVIAITDVKTLVLDGENFRKNVEANPEAEKFFGELESVYNFPRRGIVVNGRSDINGQLCATSTYNLLDGRHVLMASAIDGDVFFAQHCPMPDTARWLDAGAGIRARIALNETAQIIGIETSKSWESLESASTMLLDGAVIAPPDIEQFQSAGLFKKHIDDDTDQQLMCGCMGLTKGDIRPFITSNPDLKQICDATGAGSGCGSCMTRIGEMLSLNMRQKATITHITKESHNIHRFSFAGITAPLIAGEAGQHIVIYAEIDGQQIQRSFTLTEYAGADHGYEIAVKLEPDGKFTPWLFAQDVGSEITLSVPAGDSAFISQPQKLSMIAAGIGITPAMSVLKAIARQEIPSRDIKILHSSRGMSAPLQTEIANYVSSDDYHIWDSAKNGRLDEKSISEILKPKPGTLFWICGPEQFERDIICHLAAHGIPGHDIMIERFTVSQNAELVPEEKPRIPDIVKPDIDIGHALLDSDLAPHQEAQLLVTQIHHELGISSQKTAQRLATITPSSDFEPDSREIEYAAKLAWRNSTKCVGRLYWKGLEVFDRRDIDSVEALFDAMEAHLKFGTNNGQIRSTVTVLKAFDSSTSPRILSPQLIRYAGYRHADGTVTGDPGHVELTEIATAHGWQGNHGHFDILPLMLEDAKGKIHLRELDKKDVFEIQITHPELSWFDDLGLSWHALPAISNTCMDAFGKRYPIIMNGWYMGTEIGARNLADAYRYNLLPKIAKKMGCYHPDDARLWKDKALVELNIAVLHSFRQAGATIVDHHTASQEFLTFIEQEHHQGRCAETDWSWVVPPMSGATTPLFHLGFSNKQFKPAVVGYPEKQEIKTCPFA